MVDKDLLEECAQVPIDMEDQSDGGATPIHDVDDNIMTTMTP